ncbi:ABC transporter substrate-binding protein [uncultured Paludibaculum sp.]|uniref:ABC transporter substrate-binding protein n=1 Tax=uncultured Paludibaculum sp. TaxID=1765020 RepID=UPI002AAAAB50|nr:ABC transporter substrate-binding protein [uncultured Paludibaculum sp.]
MNPNDAPQRPKSKAKVIVAIAALTFLVALFSWWSARRDRVGTLRSITIAQYGDVFLYAPLYIAKDAGFFARKGLDVSLVSTGGDEKTWAAVISGSASFGVADPTFVAISDSRGQPGRVIASIVNGVPFWGVTLRQDIKPFSGPRDLDSHTVATFPAPSTAYTLQRKMFMQAGLKPMIREGAFGTLLTMLRAGQADIALELEPNVSQAEPEGARIVYSMPEVYGDFAITGLTATPESLARDPELARSVVCGLQMALDYAHRQPEASLQILTKRFPEIKPAIAKSAFTRLLATGIVPKSVVVQSTAWEKAIGLRVEVGDLTAAKSLASYVDNTFSDGAMKSCHID